MEEIVARVRSAQIAAGEILQPPATEADISAVRDERRRRFGAVLPERYATFLRLCNGLDLDGYQILGSTDMDLFTAALGGAGKVLRDGISGEVVDVSPGPSRND